MTSELEKLCEKRRVKISSKYGGAKVPEGWTPGTHPWLVTLRYRGRSLTTPFFQGPAIEHEPTPADVLYCLLADVSGFENARSFEDWCGDYGYDTDSRKAEKTWKAIEKQVPKLRRLLGDDFDAFVGAEH
jgi:hypothetical protein